MLSELWSFIKLSLKRRMILYEAEVVGLTLFGSYPDLPVRFFGLGLFLVACLLLMPFFTSMFTSQLKFLFLKRCKADQRLKNEVDSIGDLVGARASKVCIAKGLNNAFVCFGTLVLGEELLNRVSPSGRRAVIAHELGHMKERHMWLKIVVALVLLAPPLWSWTRLYWPIIINEYVTQLMLNIMINITSLAYLMVVMLPLNWYLELRADRVAVEIAGKAGIISALLAIVNREKFELASEDHPAISDRVKAILKDKPKNGLIEKISIILGRLTKKVQWIAVCTCIHIRNRS